MLDGVAVGGGPRDGRRELVVPLVDVLVEVLLVHQPVQVEEARLPDEGEHDQLEWPTQNNTIIQFSLEQEICNGLSHSKQNSADFCSSDIIAFVRIPWQCSAYTRLRLCVLNATCLPHDGADGGERADALLGVRPVEKHVGAVEEVRHRQLHEHVVEGHLRDGIFNSRETTRTLLRVSLWDYN